MRDVQISIAGYHDATAGYHVESETFETPARATVAFIQKVNEVLRQQLGQSEKYRRIFTRALHQGDPGAELIEAFRYVRNATSHQLFRAGPTTSAVFGGLGLGYLTTAHWQPIPRRVHNRLHAHTRALRPYYDRHLVDHPVMETFLDAAKYFATICPLIVHRDHRGEWTGFPLRSQPGVNTRLHPDEPGLEHGNSRLQIQNSRWLNRRPPGGDFRLICGRATIEGRDVVFGLTFRGSVAFSPFVETGQQASRDVVAGYPYFLGPESDQLRYEELGPYRHGATIRGVVSDLPVSRWIGDPITSIDGIEPFLTFMTPEQWFEQVRLDRDDYLVRRSQRLAAVFPPM